MLLSYDYDLIVVYFTERFCDGDGLNELDDGKDDQSCAETFGLTNECHCCVTLLDVEVCQWTLK